jgi:hypothetical protein
MKRLLLITSIVFAVGAVSAQAITHADAESRFHHYIVGRCGNALYSCTGLAVSGCRRVGNQPGYVQWACSGWVFERLKVFGRMRRALERNRSCLVQAGYRPDGSRAYGKKTCGLTPG